VSDVSSDSRFPVLPTLAALIFAAAHLAYEHFTGGVQSHHVLNRPDLPAISNWLGLITLPLLGIGLGLRIRSQSATASRAGIPAAMLRALFGSLLYGAVLATSFEFGVSMVTSAAFFGLFLWALVLPIYRAEYMLGFVAGMTFTFGGVLPFLIASVFAAISFIVRSLIRAVAAVLRKK